MEDEHEFDVAFSFAGEDRAIVEDLYRCLKERGIRVFYDRGHEATLWGKNLVDHLSELYSMKARYCIVFISRNYVTKEWTRLERQHAQERAFRSHEEYVLPLRLDDSELPGLASTVAYIDLSSRSVEEVADLVHSKLKGAVPTTSKDGRTRVEDIPLPKIRRNFLAEDRVKLAKTTFGYVRDYFARALEALGQDAEVDTRLENISDTKFLATLHLRGEIRQKIKIWIGGWGPGSCHDQLCYSLGTTISIDNDNSTNGWATIQDDGYGLSMKLENFGLSGRFHDKEVIGDELIAKALWWRFSSSLEY